MKIVQEKVEEGRRFINKDTMRYKQIDFLGSGMCHNSA